MVKRYQVYCGIGAALAATGLASCGREHGSAGNGTPVAHLRTDAAVICDKNSAQLVFELPAEGGYFLNKSPFDSVGLRAWFQQRLATRPSRYRLVFVQADSSRVRELGWLVPTIEAGGGDAYAPDAVCVHPVAARQVRAPAAARAIREFPLGGCSQHVAAAEADAVPGGRRVSPFRRCCVEHGWS